MSLSPKKYNKKERFTVLAFPRQVLMSEDLISMSSLLRWGKVK